MRNHDSKFACRNCSLNELASLKSAPKCVSVIETVSARLNSAALTLPFLVKSLSWTRRFLKRSAKERSEAVLASPRNSPRKISTPIPITYDGSTTSTVIAFCYRWIAPLVNRKWTSPLLSRDNFFPTETDRSWARVQTYVSNRRNNWDEESFAINSKE